MSLVSIGFVSAKPVTVSSALEDGVLTGDEVERLNSLKENYHISDEQARAIIEMLSNNREKNDK